LLQRYITTLNTKDQNITLIKSGINYGLYVSLSNGDGIPLAFLYHVDATFASWVWRCINTLWLANTTSIGSTTNTSLMALQTLKQITQYNKYCIWNLKLIIQIKMNMTLLETYWPWIISKLRHCVKRPNFLCCTILWDVDF